ncbi:MAG: ester cyclase [Meiothermus sp.]|nr:ester cyclase [Meiothermus sp.]
MSNIETPHQAHGASSAASVGANPKRSPPSEANKGIIRQFFAAWNAHDVERAIALIDPGCNGGGFEGARREFEAFFKAFPDLEVSLEVILAEEDRVVTRCHMHGTQQGDFMGVPASGRRAEMKAHHIFKLQDGQIVQRLGQMDRLEVMQQLGMKLVKANP